MNILVEEQGPQPERCPICNRVLRERWQWWTVDREAAYPFMVCWGGKPRWLKAIHRRTSVILPAGAHYAFRLEREPPWRSIYTASFEREMAENKRIAK